MVDGQYRLVREHLGIEHLRLVMGTSMGGMHVWTWGERYPDFMDALLLTAAQPAEVAGPQLDAAAHGDRFHPQRPGVEWRQLYQAAAQLADGASLFRRSRPYGGTPQAIHRAAPTAGREGRSKLLDQRVWPSRLNADANDVIYQLEASRLDYNPAPKLATVPGAGATPSIRRMTNQQSAGIGPSWARTIKRVKLGRYVLIPAGPETRGHGTMGLAKLWKQYLMELMQPPEQAAK